MAELRPNIVFHDRHFVHHLGICNPICVKLLNVMSGVIPSNLKSEDGIEEETIKLKATEYGPERWLTVSKIVERRLLHDLESNHCNTD